MLFLTSIIKIVYTHTMQEEFGELLSEMIYSALSTYAQSYSISGSVKCMVMAKLKMCS